jgi:hypothetical protein
MKWMLIGLATALAGTTAALVYELHHRSATPAVAAVSPVSQPSRPPPLSPPIVAAPPSMRAQVREVVAVEVAPLKTPQEVDHYLAELSARAKRNRHVGALEVMPGIRAIRQLGPEIGTERVEEKVAEFTQLMAKLSAEFDPQPPRPAFLDGRGPPESRPW